MGRLLIYDSNAKVDSRGVPVPWTNIIFAPDGSVATPMMPIRLVNYEEEIRFIGLEWLLDGAGFRASDPQGASNFNIKWWLEYFNDKPYVGDKIPTNRDWYGVDPSAGWGRELVATNGGAGNITMSPALRSMTFVANRNQFNGETLYAQGLAVHGYWVRVRFYVDQAASSGYFSLDTVETRLRCWALVGGHDETDDNENQAALPYAYNAFSR